MKIAVCLKQVPDSGSVSIDPLSHTLLRKNAGTALNPLDEFPIEAALRIKDKTGAYVAAFTMGPPRAEEVLARAMAMGVDEAFLLSDKAFAGGDTWATSLVLSEALRKYGPFDLVLCGKQAIDGDTAQVGPEIAAKLGYYQASSVNHLKIPENKNPAELEISRLFENGSEKLLVPLPAVLMILKEACEPRFGSLSGRINYFRKGVRKISAADLDMPPESFGLKGSPTRVVKTAVPQLKREMLKLDGSSDEKASELAKIIKNKLQSIF